MPLFWLSLAFIAGIVLADRVQLPTIAWLGIAGGCLVLGLGFTLWQRRTADRRGIASRPSRFAPHLLLFACLTFSLGAACYQHSLPDFKSPDFIAYYNDLDQEVRVTGVVSHPPQVLENRANVRLRVESIQLVGEPTMVPVEGYLLARLRESGSWQYSDHLQVRGTLSTPPEFEDFSYRGYLAQQGIYSYMGDAIGHRLSSGAGNPILGWIYAYKDHALRVVYRLWPDPEASLLAGILLGDESGIPEDVYQAFRDTGTSHVIVISGFNITIVAALLVGVFSRLFGSGQFGVRRAAVFALLGIALYTILVGADAAVVRAAIMGSLALLAALLGRRQAGLNTLALVAGLMAAINPQVLWSVSFQLSFAATLGLVLYADPMKEAFERLAARFFPLEAVQKWSPAVGEYFLFTLAAQVMVLPVIIYHFQQVSLSSLLANPLILPVQPPLMMLGGLALLAGTIYLPLGKLLAWIAWACAVYTIRVVEWLADIQGGVVNLGQVRLGVVIAFYGLLFAATYAARRSWKVRERIKPGVVIAGMAVLTILVWRSVLAAPDGRLHMTFLDVGTGDGVLIETPTGHQVLIDGGPSQRALSDALGRRLPLGSRQLDWLVVAAGGEAQLGGLPSNLERFPPQNVLWAGPTSGSYPARTLQATLTGLGIKPSLAEAGQRLELGQGAYLEVLAVGKRGATLLLSWGNFRLLLPVGLDFDMLEQLGSNPGLTETTALLLAESGYAPVNPPEWIGKLHPQVILLSVAAGDRDGLPSPEAMDAAQGYTLLRTDRNGWIHLSTDGKQLWVEVEKE